MPISSIRSRAWRSFVALNHGSQLAGNLAYFHRKRVALRNYDAVQDVTFGKHAEQLSAIVNDADSANVSRSHELRRFRTVAEALVE